MSVMMGVTKYLMIMIMHIVNMSVMMQLTTYLTIVIMHIVNMSVMMMFFKVFPKQRES